MNTTTQWERVPATDRTLPYLGVTHGLWNRLFDGESIYTVLPTAQEPGPNDGGYRTIQSALTVKGLMSVHQWADPEETYLHDLR